MDSTAPVSAGMEPGTKPVSAVTSPAGRAISPPFTARAAKGMDRASTAAAVRVSSIFLSFMWGTSFRKESGDILSS